MNLRQVCDFVETNENERDMEEERKTEVNRKGKENKSETKQTKTKRADEGDEATFA